MELIKDTYQTIEQPVEVLLRERGSKFLGYAYPVLNENDIKEALEGLQKIHPKATHHCYAYRLGLDKNNFRANDDGEPSGTAGRPILGQIDSFGMTNVLIVVVRYFGGTKLGATGLIQAYKETAHQTLLTAKIIEKTLQTYFEISFDYALSADVMNALKKEGFEILAQEYNEKGTILQAGIRKSEAKEGIIRLKSHILNISYEQASTIEELEGITIEILAMQ